MGGLPVYYVVAVGDEQGRKQELRRRYSEFASLLERLSEECRYEAWLKLPPKLPVTRGICGSLDRRQQGLGKLLAMLVAVAQKPGDDSEAIRRFLNLRALLRSSSSLRSKDSSAQPALHSQRSVQPALHSQRSVPEVPCKSSLRSQSSTSTAFSGSS